jgi:flagellar basal-body rod protein FlgB
VSNILDRHLGVHATALTTHARRAEVLANNLANADTPGFKARDVDFRQALAAAAGESTGAVALRTTRAGHIPLASDASAAAAAPDLKYRTPLAPSLDGNTVDAQMEQSAFAENAVRYQATLSFLSSKFRGLMTAITGQ